MTDLRQTPEYAKYMSVIGWIVDRKNGVNYFIRKFPIIGSFVKIQRPEKIDFGQINKIAKKYRAFQIIIEPVLGSGIGSEVPKSIIRQSFKQSKSPFVPAKTIHIDLTKSESQLLEKMHYKTRYNIKIASKKGVKIKLSKDIQNFANFWQECAKKQRGMFISQKREIIELYKAFGKKAHLILCYLGEELVSGILLIRTKDIAYYMYAASSDLGKKFFAPTLNAWV